MRHMDQITLGLDPLPKKTRKEIFLEEMNQVVPWDARIGRASQRDYAAHPLPATLVELERSGLYGWCAGKSWQCRHECDCRPAKALNWVAATPLEDTWVNGASVWGFNYDISKSTMTTSTRLLAS